MDATCTIQDSIHVFNLVHKYVSRILGTYQRNSWVLFHPFIYFTSYRSCPCSLAIARASEARDT